MDDRREAPNRETSKGILLFAVAMIILVSIIIALSMIASGIGSLGGICNPECL
jgi:hypothetical protein